MLEEAEDTLETLTIDHFGLVAATCKDLKIAQKIDEKLGKIDERRVVSCGQSVVAMILNGLGFVNRRLYLTHQFFENKPVELLLDANIQAKDITDYTLGHALDEIASYGSTELFAEVAFEIALENNLLGMSNHLDTTSIVVHGEYEQKEAGAIEITYGHSKEKRHDLKQFVLSLVVNGPSSMPLFMETLKGNNSDKTSFHETIEKVRAFQEQIKLGHESKWIMDSAWYAEEKLLGANDYLWVSRVPETIKEAKELVKRDEKKLKWKEIDKGYRLSAYDSEYGGVEQRWLLVYSDQAFKREEKTFEKELDKQAKGLKKALWHLGNQLFETQGEAERALEEIKKNYKYYKITGKIIKESRYERRGRPKAGEDTLRTIGIRVEGSFKRNKRVIKKTLNTKGRFILATNDLDKVNYPDEQMIKEYKEQQKVENGFKFLKDPWFMLDSVFLKTPKRIEALMMVMTLCLLVYNISQYRVRQKLQEEKKTLPNQLAKEVQNPTMRWIFQLMEGIGVIRFYEYKDNMKVLIKQVVTNLSELRKKIIRLLGETACQMYGLIPKSC